MPNTIIQIKRSVTTQKPASLQAGELAYSYSSNVVFIGTNGGTDVIAIGGQRYVDQVNAALFIAQTAFGAANAAGSSEAVASIFNVANAAFVKGNSAHFTANAAFDKANSANILAFDTSVITTASFAKGNAAHLTANAAYVAANGAFLQGNSAFGAANGAFLQGNSAFGAANASFNAANGAFITANNALPKAGGTITGDLVIQGNATFSGTVTYANTQTLLIGDNILTLNADIPNNVAPSENAGIEVNRGSSANVAVLWNEGTDRWTFTNDGSNYLNIASTADTAAASDSANAFTRVYANAIGVAANSYAATVGVSANAYAQVVGAAANAFMISTQNGANTAVGAGANAFASQVGVSANAYASAVGVAANSYAQVVGAAANSFMISTQNGANTAVGAGANAYASQVGVSANAYAALVGAAANTNAANATYLTVGTVPTGRLTGAYTGITGLGTITQGAWNADTITVPYGGTGRTSATTNGILFGNGTGAFGVTGAGTEGQVLQANASGVPNFGMLDGGSF
jgi:hypothetical protein